MSQDINKKLEDVLNGVDKNKLLNSKKTLEQMLNSPEGKKLMQNIGSIDKTKLMNIFNRIDSNELKSKLQNVDLSKISNIKADDIINKLK